MSPTGPPRVGGPVAVVVVAAGSGSRLGAQLPKALVPLGGVPLVGHAVAAAAACPGVRDVVVVGPRRWLEQTRAGYDGQVPAGVAVHLVPGGAQRGDSVAAGLAAVPTDVEVILVHDAARALAPPALFAAVVDAVRAGHPGVVPGLPIIDTIKQVDDTDSIVSTVDRSRLRAVQTPQGFAREVLQRAHDLGRRAGDSATTGATDDATLVERLGLPVLVIPGDPLALKITTSTDLALAEHLLATRADRTQEAAHAR